ncbi:MAG: GH25 family lysozyme [Elusimicrobia bacterium]|nr:GH25 family lysozyme [Elusimicrobiota bacterium]
MAHLATLAAAGLLSLAAPVCRAQVFEGTAALDEQMASIHLVSRQTAARLTASHHRQVSAARRHKKRHGQRMGAGRRHRKTQPVKPTAKPDISPYPVRGMDVSHYENTIDWDKVKGHGLSFVYIKATDGDDIQDAQFKANWEGATKAGLLKGAYHFYDFCTDAAPQVDNLLAVLPPEAGMLPLAVDLEMSVECKPKEMPTKEAFLKQFDIFMAAVVKAYGRKPILYLESGIYTRYLQGIAENYVLWYPDPDSVKPETPNNLKWSFWQYSFHGHTPGVPTEVDLDVFAGTLQELSALAGGSSTVAAR